MSGKRELAGDIGILDLLELRGFDRHQAAKLVRHQDRRFDVHDLYRRGWLEAYQSFQAKPIFHKCTRIVSFLGLDGRRARFVGVYRVLGHRPGDQGVLPKGSPFQDWLDPRQHYYDLVHEPGYEALEGRVIIDWGPGPLAWHQKLSNKPVDEVLPRGQPIPVFDDYLEFALTHRELQEVFQRAEAHREWRARLSAVAGVYMVLATTTGQQYVGSATGADGIWGRWAEYAANGHGGNALLKDLVENDTAYPACFSFSLLQVLPKTLTRSEALAWERRYKEKLGSRATGLNGN